MEQLGSSCKSGRRTVDSFRGNKLKRDFQNPKSPYFDEIIVYKSEQILPVFAFARSETNNADQLHQFHAQVQELADRTINYVEDYASGNDDTNFIPRRTAVPRIFPDYEDLKFEHKLYVSKRKRFQERLRFSFLSDGTVSEKRLNYQSSQKRRNTSGAVPVEEMRDHPEINSRDLRDSSWQTGIFAGRRNYFLQPPGSFTAYRTFSYGFIVRIAHILFELDSMDLRLEYIRSLRDDRSPASKSSLIKGAIISQSKKGAKYQPMLYMLYLPLQQLVAIYKR
jgi:hypothetical protein